MAIINIDADRQIVAAFNAVSFDAAEAELTDFVATTLNLNPSERATLLPDANTPADDERRLRLDHIAAALIAHRNHVLQTEARIPSAVLFKQTDGVVNRASYLIEGLVHYLSRNAETGPFLERVRECTAVRDYLAGIGDGSKLEALAGSILREIFESAYATRRSFDQGVDCFASEEILHLHSWCCNVEMLSALKTIGERVHIIASCKANEGNAAGGIPALLPPAHLRELIGAWLIQRCDSGLWHRRAGIKFLSPLQLLLVTTYRLSDDSLSLCQETGVAVWGVPELVYLICRHAPDSVFPAAGGYKFLAATADAWLETSDQNRAAPEAARDRRDMFEVVV